MKNESVISFRNRPKALKYLRIELLVHSCVTRLSTTVWCDFFLHLRERVPKGKGSVQVNTEPNSSPTFQPLGLEQHNVDLNHVETRNHPIRGSRVQIRVKNRSASFDVPLYMHPCCVGVFKLFLHFWIDKKTQE